MRRSNLTCKVIPSEARNLTGIASAAPRNDTSRRIAALPSVTRNDGPMKGLRSNLFSPSRTTLGNERSLCYHGSEWQRRGGHANS